MKESTRLRIYAIAILIVFAFIDAIPFTAVTALIGIVILLFRPKWFQRIVNRMYD
jgi:hypothetical protein